MRIGRYHIEFYKSLLRNEYKELFVERSHKYWYLWDLCVGLYWFMFTIEVCRTDWNKCYKESCANYTNKCKHCMDCNECKECFKLIK